MLIHSNRGGPRWLGVDVGGANLKAAHADGQAQSSSFAVWKEPDRLGEAITELASRFPPFDRVAATMTAELCDCYATKREGVLSITRALARAFDPRPVLYWGTDGRFHDVETIRGQPLLAAASNWVALATVAARLVGDAPGLLIDVGGTTTDLIPLQGGRVVAQGRTDLERLRTGELVYAGVTRSPICALARELPFQGEPTGLAAELFATTKDVYLLLGDVPPNAADVSTADGLPATPDAALNRLARMVGADRETCSRADAEALAGAVDRVLTDRLVEAARRVCRATIGAPGAVVTGGEGEFLARRAASAFVGDGGVVQSLANLWGRNASDAACAYALVELVSDQDDEIR